MKHLLIISFLLSIGCATDPYKSCYEYSDQDYKNRCLNEVRQNEQAKAEWWFAHRSAFQAQPVQTQQQSWPTRTQTNCTYNYGGINCTSY